MKFFVRVKIIESRKREKGRSSLHMFRKHHWTRNIFVTFSLLLLCAVNGKYKYGASRERKLLDRNDEIRGFVSKTGRSEKYFPRTKSLGRRIFDANNCLKWFPKDEKRGKARTSSAESGRKMKREKVVWKRRWEREKRKSENWFEPGSQFIGFHIKNSSVFEYHCDLVYLHLILTDWNGRKGKSLSSEYASKVVLGRSLQVPGKKKLSWHEWDQGFTNSLLTFEDKRENLLIAFCYFNS